MEIIEKIRKIDKFRLGLMILFAIILFTISIYASLWSVGDNKNMVISMLNIGQGDAIYIKAPNGKELIIDGGPDSSLISELGSIMPFFDKKIDMILVTNPDKDHYAGFIDLLDKYKVDQLVEPGTISSTPTYHTFKEKVKEKGLVQIIARRGMKIVLDKERNVYLDILFPDKDVESFSTNDGSIVAKLVYGNTSMMFQGDSPQKIENYLIDTYGETGLKADILKAGHHGSRTSTGKNYVEAVSPKWVLISCGQNNKYGHPHKETLETLKEENIEVLRTDLDGRITFVSDGSSWERR